MRRNDGRFCLPMLNDFLSFPLAAFFFCPLGIAELELNVCLCTQVCFEFLYSAVTRCWLVFLFVVWAVGYLFAR